MVPARENQQGKVRIALLMLVGSATLFGCMAFVAKLASERLDGAEVAMLRFFWSFIPLLVLPGFRKAAFTFKRLDLLIYRGVFGGIAVLFYFLAIQHIPVGIATLLNYISPIFSGIFAAIFIGEPLRPRAIIPLIIAFGGVVLVTTGQSGHEHLFGFGPWQLVGFCSAMLSGAAVTAIRVARRTESSWAIFASFSLFGLLSTAPFGIARWQNPTSREWLLLIGVGVLSLGAQLLMTSAYRWVETVSAGVISQLAVIVSMVLGWIFLGERLATLSLLGTALTIAGITLIMLVTSQPTPSAFDEAAEQ
jgi:drug/metabolite transporter (DMT)-like permease